jgi:hypothetical protein
MAIPTHSPCIKGDPGDSAYKVAVTNGFVGTEAEWLLSLVGTSGTLTPEQIANIASQIDVSNKVDKITGKSLVSDTDISKIHSPGSDDQNLSLYVTTDDSRLEDARPPITHSHSASDVTGTAVVTNDSRLTNSRPASDVSLWAKAVAKPVYTYSEVGAEPANSDIQIHINSAHAPSTAQINSDITKAEIEAKLTGAISSHSHAGGAGLGYTLSVQALTSSPTDSQTVYFGNLPKAPITTANVSKIYIRKAGTIKIAEIYCYSGTAGTAEAWSLYIRKNNTTDTLIKTLTVNTNERIFTNEALNIPVVAGDYIEIKGVQPLWATNPLTCIYAGYLYIE